MSDNLEEGYLELKLNSWIENAAICGLVNILGKENIEILDQSIKVPISELESFEQKYFSYFSERYKETASLTKILAYQEIKEKHELDNFVNFDEQALKNLAKYCTEILKRFGTGASYVTVYQLLNPSIDIISLLKQAEDQVKLLKNVSSDKDDYLPIVKEIYKLLTEIFDYYTDEKNYRYLAAKNQIYLTIRNGIDGVSFLNPAESKGDMFQKYQEHFLVPVEEYLETSHEKDRLHCTTCGRSVKSNKFSFGFINTLGFDTGKKNSNAWNYTNDLVMCPVCRLMYTCIPAGITYVYRQGIFVNDNHSVSSLLDVNTGILLNVMEMNDKGKSASEKNTYAALIKTLQEVSFNSNLKNLNDIQVVRYENDKYYFNILPRNVLMTLARARKEIANLNSTGYTLNGTYQSLYQQVISYLINSTNLFSLINLILRTKLNGDTVYMNDWQLTDLIYTNQIFLEELIEVTELDKETLLKIRGVGYAFKREYDNENKPKAIALRLLNALRADDRNGFMNLLLNSYLYINKPVPKYFTEVFLEDERFQTIGLTFVSGIIGEIKQGDGGNDNE
ncbi:type I-B CRISPR-associated protein Cas8b1/Cst1 [Enterococcus sp. LJL120]